MANIGKRELIGITKNKIEYIKKQPEIDWVYLRYYEGVLDLVTELEKIESINININEALEILDYISKEECLFKNRSTVYMGGEKVESFTWKHTIGDHFKGIDIIKEVLLKLQSVLTK